MHEVTIVESSVVSKQIEVSGHSYAAKTGMLTEVVAPARAGVPS
jgi:hypothetical protein